MDASQNSSRAETEAHAIEIALKGIASHVGKQDWHSFDHIERHLKAFASDMRNVVKVENKANQADFRVQGRPISGHPDVDRAGSTLLGPETDRSGRQELRERVRSLGRDYAEKVVDEVCGPSLK